MGMQSLKALPLAEIFVRGVDSKKDGPHLSLRNELQPGLIPGH